MHILIVIPLLLYLCLVFALSFYSYVKRKKKEQFVDYFIGNRTMGGFLLAMTMAATYISAGSFIGGPGAAYKFGLGWVLLSMIQVPTLLLGLGILGKKFAILARKYNAITLNDMLYARYQSKLLVGLASFSMLIAFMATMTVQFVGGAYLLQSAIHLKYEYGLVIFGLGTVFYTAFGGFRASILNDAFQGIVMLIGALFLLGAIITAGGGIQPIVTKLNHIDPRLLSPYGSNQIMDFPFMVSFWILVCFGTIGLPHTAMRCMAYKNSQALHQGIIIGTIVMTIIMLTMHLAGTLGRAILPNLTEPDHVIPELIAQVLPPFAAGMFLAAPLAAIMSTINAQLLQVSSIIVNDIFLTIFAYKKFNDTFLMQLSVIMTFLIGFLLLITAWHPPKMLIWLNLFAFGGLEAVFLWPLVLGLYWQKANATGALTSMFSGGICYIIFNYFSSYSFGFHAIVPALLSGILAFWIGNFFHKTEQKIVYALDTNQN